MIDKIKRVFQLFVNALKPKCPECNGILDSEMFDLTIDQMVYKCRDCCKEFI